MNLSNKIKKSRKTWKINQQEAAELIGISYNAYRKIESGKAKTPNFYTVLAICHFFKIDLNNT